MKDLNELFKAIDAVEVNAPSTRLGVTMRREDLTTDHVKEDTMVPKEISMRVQSGITAGVNIYIWGPTGSGKSLIAREKLHAEKGDYLRVNCSSGMIVEDLIAAMVSFTDANGNVAYEPRLGPLALAQEWGIPVIIEEIDSLQDEQQHALFQWMEVAPKKSTTLQGVALHWSRHKDFVCIATGNTNGMGDTSGMYSGTRPMNAALLNRFSKVIEVGYLDEASELALFSKKFPGLPKEAYSGVMAICKATRNPAMAQTLNMGGVRPVSTRLAVEWLKAIMHEKRKPLGMSYMDIARDLLIDRAENEVRTALETLIVNSFGTNVRTPIKF